MEVEMRAKDTSATLAVGLLLLLVPGKAIASSSTTGTILYGGVGGDTSSNSSNIGALVIVDQTTAALTLVGTPVPGTRISGVAFDSTGALFGSTIGIGTPPITSTLIRIDPNTGALISVIGPITDGPGGLPIGVADLAVQPGTDLLFGVRAPTDLHGGAGKLYVIDKTTGVGTFVGTTPNRRDSIAFTPNGTLYEVGFVPGAPTLYTLNPATGAALTSIAVAEFYGSLAARPTDSVLFAGNGDVGQIFNLDPATGAATLLGDTSPTFIGGLAFRTCAIAIGGATANPSSLWPPNHKMVNVTVNYTATDSCGTAAPVSCSLSIASNEGSSLDWSVVDAHHVQLRAERAGNGNGRIYTVTITCTDTAGSSSDAAVTVTVAHDQGHG
jgi:hypothetical protein